jgi:hypothetical protein
MESQQLMLDLIFNDISSHGACTCLFSRTEYQKDSGNFPHEHTILALKKDTLTALDYDQLNNLIATNVMEIVKPDQVAKYTNYGLLSCPEDVDIIIQEGWRKLKHTCSDGCVVKIGLGNGPENYRCRKQHTVKDTPDPTSHNFIKLPCNLSNASKSTLKGAGINIPSSYKGARDEKYTIPYFQPTRHMAPCITNALCNMSSIIPIYFLMFRFVHNAQIILQASGTPKHICKYITKRDKGNRAIFFANGCTDDIRVGSQFLHNTEIATSAINESKAFQSKRYKYHPIGTDVPDIYCLHLILGYPEITNNIPFIPNNTGPFESCTQHTVSLDQRGKVICNTMADDDVGQQPGPHDINGPRFPNAHISSIQPQQIQETLGMSQFRLFTATQLINTVIKKPNPKVTTQYQCLACARLNLLVFFNRPSLIFDIVMSKERL